MFWILIARFLTHDVDLSPVRSIADDSGTIRDIGTKGGNYLGRIDGDMAEIDLEFKRPLTSGTVSIRQRRQ